MENRLKSDPDLRRVAEVFFDAARNSVCNDSANFVELMNQGRFWLYRGVEFDANKSVVEAQHQLVARCVKLLGPKASHERELTEIAWDCVLESLVGDSPTSVLTEISTRFLDKLSTYTLLHFQLIAPNYAIRFEGLTRKIQIGPVEAIVTSGALTEIEKIKSSHLTIAEGSKFDMVISGGDVKFTFPPVIWRVATHAAKENVREEAAWLINMALSFLRLTWPLSGRHNVFFPKIGEIEAAPLKEHIPLACGLVISNNDEILGGGNKGPNIYFVDDVIASSLSSPAIQAKASAIFQPNKKSLAERFGQGLGWLTRGRQTGDRAERFLFFFTAIESLLSSDDKSTPVVQTIARYTAVILQDQIEMRSQLAKIVKKHYEARSALVHAGKRNISNIDANTIQFIAERLYRTVMEKMELTTPFEEFHHSLAEASYGLRWPIHK